LYRIIRSFDRRWVLQYLDSQFADVFAFDVDPRRPMAAAADDDDDDDDAMPSFGGGGGEWGGGEHTDLGTTTRRATTTTGRRDDAVFVDAIVFVSFYADILPRRRRVDCALDYKISKT
jgi:hypothetical protein